MNNGTNGHATGDALAAPLLALQQPAGSQPQTQTTTNGNARKFVFRKAVKFDAKLRIAISGPGGSGKTYTLLKLATELGGRIAFVDTEHGSASKYADEFQFDVLELDSYDPATVPDLIAAVAAQGYSTLILDSLSHFWMGKGGELEKVDAISARSKSNNSWAAWRTVSPQHNGMIDAMLMAPIHILVSMRVKTEWVVERDEKTGKSSPRKIGLQPVMRDGVEYEFDVCGDMDQDNTLIVTKSRCPKLNGKCVQKPGREMALILREWLASPEIKQEPAPAEATAKPEATPTAPARPWKKLGEAKEIITRLRERVGETAFDIEMAKYHFRTVNDFDPRRPQDVVELYHALMFLANGEGM